MANTQFVNIKTRQSIPHDTHELSTQQLRDDMNNFHLQKTDANGSGDDRISIHFLVVRFGYTCSCKVIPLLKKNGNNEIEIIASSPLGE